MKKILVLNHTRMGDLIQTTPLLTGLKEKYPDSEVTLLGNVKFASVCKHAPNIDKLMILDVAQFIKDDEETSILDVYRYLENLVDELKGMKFDIVINLSHSKFSAALTRHLGAKEVHGFNATEDGLRIINDPWLVYFSSFLVFRKLNSLNLVDINQLGGGVTPKARSLVLNTEEPKKLALTVLEKIGIKDGERVIGIQAGSSLKERRWPSEHFAAAADIISRKRGAKVILFGAPSEAELGKEVESAMKEPCINLIGETSLDELIGLVERCELLITNDTGTMHIAASVGTPSVALFLVHAFAAETGPHSIGNVIIEPDMECFPCAHNTTCPHYACLTTITPEEVAEAAEIVEKLKTDPGYTVDPNQFPGKRLLTQYFDEAGLLDLRPITKSPLKDEDAFARMYRYYFALQVTKGLNDSYWKTKLEKDYIEWSDEKTVEWAEKKIEVFQKLASASQKGIKMLTEAEKHYRKGKVEKVQVIGDALLELDSEIEVLGHTNMELKPLVRLFELGKENLTAGDVGLMMVKTKLLYKGILTGTAFMIRLLGVWSSRSKSRQNMETLEECL